MVPMDMQIKKVNSVSRPEIGRREFIALGLLTAASEIVPRQAFAAVHGFLSPARTLSFYNTHTGESLKSIYWREGSYLPEALARINHILRDHRTGEVKTIDFQLIDLLFVLRKKLRSREPFHVISGYRSLKTNTYLRKKGRGVAKNSLHLIGKAIDIRLPNRDLHDLRRTAVKLKRGGVGYYPGSDFVHVDVGKVRYW